MKTDPSPSIAASSATWPARQVLLLSGLFLLLGLAIGYFFLGTKLSTAPTANARPQANLLPQGATHPKLSPDQLKQMAAVQTSALIEKLKTDPTNVPLLMQVATIFNASHQCSEASEYYNRVLKADPKNLLARTELASCLYSTGDADGAIAQLNQSLKIKPSDANSLFNLGVIKWKGKNDPAGAIAAWQELLKSNPNLERRPVVEHMIAEVQAENKTTK